MRPRPDLVCARAEGAEVFQLTTEELPSSHVYMEAQIFTLDSKRLVLHRSAHAHGSDPHDPEHRYLLVDLENGGAMSPLTDELAATAPSVSPDGQYFYYILNQTEPGGGRVELKRVKLDGTGRETIVVIDGPLRDSGFRPSRIYPLTTISSDGQRLAVAAFLGDGQTPGAAFGLLVFDVPSASVRLILQGISWCNLHPQFSRSLDPVQARDILIQENHGNLCDARGDFSKLVSGLGADIHVIRDDGQGFRNMPWGRDGVEACQGHQCWRGRSDWAITSTVTRVAQGKFESRLIEGRALPHKDHDGLTAPGAKELRNELSREVQNPQFFHFATDLGGRRFIADTGKSDDGGGVYVADLGEPGKDPLLNLRRVADPRCSWAKTGHIHPFLSPDGKTGFFNSDESGRLQAYMVRGF